MIDKAFKNKSIREIRDFVIMPKGYGKASKEVRDYITNLQQENERLKAQVTLLEDNRLFLNKKIGQAIKSLKQECMFLEEWHYDGYDPQLEIIIDILEGNE